MKMKNLKPQQAAPVQREINTTSSEVGLGLWGCVPLKARRYGHGDWSPFAGDDAE